MPMSFKKSSPAIVARFENALPKSSVVEPKKMFGYPASFVHGHFFAGLHQENIVIRLPAALRQKLPEMSKATGFDPMGTGKGMKDWFVVPTAVARSEEKLAALLAEALLLVAALPPKKTNPRKLAKASESGDAKKRR